MQILVANTKGGCGKSTLVACLADVLPADIIDHDPQGTLRVSAAFTGRHQPVEYAKVTQQVVLHDSPPYNSTDITSLMQEVDLVLIPTKLMYPDLLSIATILDRLDALKQTKKAFVVFNEVRYHNKNLNEKTKALYKRNYPNVKFANTEIPNWLGFSQVLVQQLVGREQEKIKALVDELRIYLSNS